ncbi:hypothetical protein [Roseibacillus persicicus]|uniref:Uncharacterized protein n=1 Tax=Roseibacillus persicicus TaxID=454148 RepID=A0A918WIX8_9BACT|nr:hypothetical protein [Roseibacillus persicicus]GHC50692.1 hypothetical protein GCM10007100_15990 [Roseibacillus persicicus]
MSGTNNPNDPKVRARAFLLLAGILLLSLPILRLLEVGLRLRFMREHYGDLWQALTKDLWLSGGWWSYFATPLGFVMTILPLALILGIALCLFAAIRITKDRG